MAAKTRTTYRCTACNTSHPKWVGRCTQCQEWGTVVEAEAEATQSVGLKSTMRAATVARKAQRVGDIRTDRAKHATTGIGEFDRVLGGGFVAGGVILLAGEPGVGKALALDTPIATPSGWSTMGDLSVGDFVFGADGLPTRVIAATDVLKDRPCYEVKFSDGTTVIADADHQWLTRNRMERVHGREPSTRTTHDLALSCRYGKEGRANHSVHLAAPLDLPEQDLPVPAYTLGVWLGDGAEGTSSITTADEEVLAGITKDGLLVKELTAYLRYGLSFPVPEQTLPTETDCVACGVQFQPTNFGQVSCGSGSCNYYVKVNKPERPARGCIICGQHLSNNKMSRGRCRRCANDFTLKGRLRVLGVLHDKRVPQEYLRASETQRRDVLAGLLDTDGWVGSNGTVCLEVTNKRLALSAYELVASLGYKPSWNSTKRVVGRTEDSSTVYRVTFSTRDQVFRLTRKNALLTRAARSTQRHRFIESVTPVPSVAVRCIQVENDDHMYLATKAMIPTHNSTLLIEVADKAARTGRTVLYVSGEESAEQIKLRADRVGADSTELFIAAETDLSVVLGHIEEVDPDLIIVDSVQTIASPDVDGRIGGVSQVIEVASVITRIAKAKGIPTVLVGQVTKDNEIGGPRALEHLVDTVCLFEGDKRSTLRMLRGIKNRYGAADEIGCFVHTSTGLEEVPDPSGLFLGDRSEPVPGTCVTVVVEGKRPLLAEVQSLVAGTHMPVPRRNASGLDTARLAMTQAVVERHGHIRLYDKDVYCATVGGMKILEPSADLAIALSIASAAGDTPLRAEMLALGEVTLSGDIRPVHDIERRLAEAGRMGFKVALVPAGTGEQITGRRKGPDAKTVAASGSVVVSGVRLVEVESVTRAVQALASMQVKSSGQGEPERRPA